MSDGNSKGIPKDQLTVWISIKIRIISCNPAFI